MKQLLSLLMFCATATAQIPTVYPIESTRAPGSGVAWLGATMSPPVVNPITAGCIIDTFTPTTITKLSHRVMFLGITDPMASRSLYLTLNISYGGPNGAAMASWNDHNPGTVATCFVGSYNTPTVASVHPLGGVGAIVPEPFTISYMLSSPYTVPSYTTVCVSWDFTGTPVALNGVYYVEEGGVAGYPGSPSQNGPHQPVKNTGCPSIFFNYQRWPIFRYDNSIGVYLELDITPYNGEVLGVDFYSPFFGAPVGFPVTGTTGCATAIDFANSITVPFTLWPQNMIMPLNPALSGFAIATHRIGIDGSANIVSTSETLLAAYPVLWFNAVVPNLRYTSNMESLSNWSIVPLKVN